MEPAPKALDGAFEDWGTAAALDFLKAKTTATSKWVVVTMFTVDMTQSDLGSFAAALQLTATVRAQQKRNDGWKHVFDRIAEIPEAALFAASLSQDLFPRLLGKLRRSVGKVLPRQSVFWMPVVIFPPRGEPQWVVMEIRKTTGGKVSSGLFTFTGSFGTFLRMLDASMLQVSG